MSLNTSYSQNLVCHTCFKAIEGNYVIAENRYFHPEHFVCDYCKKKLPGKFISDNSQLYHEKCYLKVKGLICELCKNEITSEYIIFNKSKYHQLCYEEVLPKCSVCEKSLTGTYSIDFYGNKYHNKHESEFARCAACNRLVTKKLTNEGKKYLDGRSICNICYPNVIFDNARISGLFEKVRIKLISFGISIPSENIKVKGVNLVDLKKVSGSSFAKGVKGFCETNTERIGRSKPKYSHTIFVLNGLPSENIESIIAHELMHVWIAQNTKRNHSKKITEGSCNYVSYFYLLSLRQSTYVKQLIEEIESDPSSVYGDGFREIRSKFNKKSVHEFLNYLKGY
ncbi:MAG: zinc ion binding protein-like [Ignavibacteria bacterium]|nr:MAG: zinc ion binding protein-like [Ignavibacteria bacterium]KAF0160342.1 MAG: zinc ion binding protein-like [Ignavibacteria bacterium]